MRTMERRSGGCSPPELNLREWGLKAKIMSGEKSNSRRYSASFMRSSFREDPNKSSFRSNFTISSTASSPGYSQRDEIDPSTYSFTTALQALQARSAYNCWESLSPEGFALNSKWNEAEKYICNPLSGEFPMECLSAKTLSGRSGRMITMSAPLIFSSSRPAQTRPFHHNLAYDHVPQRLPLQEVKIMEAMRKRDVGTQSKSPPELSSEGSRSPAASTPSIVERKRSGDYSPPSSSGNAKLVMPQQLQVDDETREENCDDDDDNGEEKEEEEEEEEKAKENGNGNGKGNENEKDENNKKQKQRRGSGGGCLSWMSKKQRHRESHKPRKTFFLLPTLKGC